MSTNHNLWRERTAEADSNRGPSAYQPNVLPLGQTGSDRNSYWLVCFFRSGKTLFFFFLMQPARHVRNSKLIKYLETTVQLPSPRQQNPCLSVSDPYEATGSLSFGQWPIRGDRIPVFRSVTHSRRQDPCLSVSNPFEATGSLSFGQWPNRGDRIPVFRSVTHSRFACSLLADCVDYDVSWCINQRWNCFNGNAWHISERPGEAHVDFPERICIYHTERNLN